MMKRFVSRFKSPLNPFLVKISVELDLVRLLLTSSDCNYYSIGSISMNFVEHIKEMCHCETVQQLCLNIPVLKSALSSKRCNM